MCGIVGLIDTRMEGIQGIVTKMRDVMFTRGPDGVGDFYEGHVAMSMRRLSIIDLEQGWQPLKSMNGNVVVFQNGEIYNYKALRKELEREGFTFITCSDTEVLAHGFAHWGIEGLLKRIDGMYALAILDRNKRELHLARDRFGEKPLFYCYAEGRFAYGSNLLALAALPWIDTDIDPVSLERYIALHFIPGVRTILKGVHRVLPGERLLISIDDPVPKRHFYYRLPIGYQHSVSDDELAYQIEEAVVSRLVADVPVGIFLSGGLDSSIVATIASRHIPRVDTFSIGFHSRDHDESIYAKHVAQAIGSSHHHFMFDENNFSELLPIVASALDEPIGDQAMLPLYWLCKEARQYVTVVLSGEGADEVFAGYEYYKNFTTQKNLGDWLKILFRRSHNPLWPYKRFIHNPFPTTPSGFPLLADVAERESLLEQSISEIDEWEQDLISIIQSSLSPLQRASGVDMVTWLPDDLLVKFDRMTMAHSLEGRAPYLQPGLVEIGLQLPPGDRMADGANKIALRRVAHRWLPKNILLRRKQGFVLPMANWLKQWFYDHGGVNAYLKEQGFPGLNARRMAEIVTEDLKHGFHRERLIFALILLIEWHRSFSMRVCELRDTYGMSA